MAKKMKAAAALCTAAAVLFLLLWFYGPDLWLTPAITAATFAYHLVMRLAVGGAYDLVLHNRVDLRRRWFQPRRFEGKLYRMLGVKGWKKHLPTYNPDLFDRRLHSWEEIAQATCQAELVHETIMVLSFVPLLAIGPFGSPGVFIATSAAAAFFDSLFVMIQRFNRFRLVRVMKKEQAKQ